MTSDILRHFGSTSNSNSEVDEQAFVVGPMAQRCKHKTWVSGLRHNTWVSGLRRQWKRYHFKLAMRRIRQESVKVWQRTPPGPTRDALLDCIQIASSQDSTVLENSEVDEKE